jgi:hypothetical protein
MSFALIYAFEYPNEWGFMVPETNMNKHAACEMFGRGPGHGMLKTIKKEHKVPSIFLVTVDGCIVKTVCTKPYRLSRGKGYLRPSSVYKHAALALT